MTSPQVTAETVEWVDPPEVGRGGGPGGVWVDRLAPFRERPGEWGRLPGEWSQSVGSQIAHGQMSGIEPGQYETQARKSPAGNGRQLVWVRYIGGSDETVELSDHPLEQLDPRLQAIVQTCGEYEGLIERWGDATLPTSVEACCPAAYPVTAADLDELDRAGWVDHRPDVGIRLTDWGWDQLGGPPTVRQDWPAEGTA